VTQKKRPATPPADVVNVIDQARATGQHDIVLYVWLVAITGVRRYELCLTWPTPWFADDAGLRASRFAWRTVLDAAAHAR
jgi:hypothetical protein